MLRGAKQLERDREGEKKTESCDMRANTHTSCCAITISHFNKKKKERRREKKKKFNYGGGKKYGVDTTYIYLCVLSEYAV